MGSSITPSQKEKITRGAALVTVAGTCLGAAFWDRHMQMLVFPLFAALGLAACIWLYRHHRVISDTHTSAIGYAEPGYAELVGTAAMLPGTPLATPDGTTCCWYNAWDANRIAWVGSKYRPSTEPFLLVDDTGVCVVLPEGIGAIGTGHESSWNDGKKRGHAHVLLAGSALYAAGELVRLQDAAPQLVAKLAHLDINALIALVRKADHAALRRETPQRAAPNPQVVNLLALRKPRDRRLFWIANEAPDTLGSNVRFGTWLSLLFFVYFAAGSVWTMVR